MQTVHPRVRKPRLPLRQHDPLPRRDGDKLFSPRHRKTTTPPQTSPSASVRAICMSARWREDCLSAKTGGSLHWLSGAVRDDPSGKPAKIMITPPHDCFHVNTVHTWVHMHTLSPPNPHAHTEYIHYMCSQHLPSEGASVNLNINY